MTLTLAIGIGLLLGAVGVLSWIVRDDPPRDADHVSAAWLRAAIRERREE